MRSLYLYTSLTARLKTSIDSLCARSGLVILRITTLLVNVPILAQSFFWLLESCFHCVCYLYRDISGYRVFPHHSVRRKTAITIVREVKNSGLQSSEQFIQGLLRFWELAVTSLRSRQDRQDCASILLNIVRVACFHSRKDLYPVEQTIKITKSKMSAREALLLRIIPNKAKRQGHDALHK